jgi:hypothetical protein
MSVVYRRSYKTQQELQVIVEDHITIDVNAFWWIFVSQLEEYDHDSTKEKQMYGM